jgi:hypothetical protein
MITEVLALAFSALFIIGFVAFTLTLAALVFYVLLTVFLPIRG